MADKILKNTDVSFYQQELVNKSLEKVVNKESTYSCFPL